MELFCQLLDVQYCIISFNVSACVAMYKYGSIYVYVQVLLYTDCDVYFH